MNTSSKHWRIQLDFHQQTFQILQVNRRTNTIHTIQTKCKNHKNNIHQPCVTKATPNCWRDPKPKRYKKGHPVNPGGGCGSKSVQPTHLLRWLHLSPSTSPLAYAVPSPSQDTARWALLTCTQTASSHIFQEEKPGTETGAASENGSAVQTAQFPGSQSPGLLERTLFHQPWRCVFSFSVSTSRCLSTICQQSKMLIQKGLCPLLS